MIPDDGTDEDTAMASVNPQMVVEMNMAGIVTPLFVDGAAPIGLVPGDNMPFAYVDWKAMQSAVVSATGAQFSVIPVEIGANQVPIPIGAGVIVSCGPFACSESPMAPEISIADSAACQGWDPMFDLEVGRVHNNSINLDDESGVQRDEMSGIDLGWSYTSSQDFNATHDIATTMWKDTKGKKASSATDLRVQDVGDGILGSEYDDTADDTNDVADACDTYTDVTGTVQEPGGAQCFRVKHDKNNDYLSNYTLTVTPKGTSVMWGEIDWDAFDGLDCSSTTYDTSAVDVCAMFAADVANLGKVTAVATVTSNVIAGWNLNFKANEVGPRNFTHLWYMQATKATSSKDATHANTVDLYTARTTTAAATGGIAVSQVSKATDTDNNVAMYWVPYLDDDGDPLYGDLGLTDTDGDNGINNSQTAWADIKCTADDGGTGRTKDSAGANNSDSTLCDAEDVMIETSVTFVDGIGMGCSETVDYTLTCQWDADGGAAVGAGKKADDRTTSPTFDTDNVGDYLSCKVS